MLQPPVSPRFRPQLAALPSKKSKDGKGEKNGHFLKLGTFCAIWIKSLSWDWKLKMDLSHCCIVLLIPLVLTFCSKINLSLGKKLNRFNAKAAHTTDTSADRHFTRSFPFSVSGHLFHSRLQTPYICKFIFTSLNILQTVKKKSIIQHLV